MPFDIFDGTPMPAAAAPQGAPVAASQPQGSAATPSYNDFVQRLIAAANAQGSANPGSLWNWLTGKQRDANVAAAQAGAPAAYQALQQGQSATQNAQLGTASSLASQGAMTGTTIDPNNIMASIPALQKAFSSVFNTDAQPGSPQAAPAQANAPLIPSADLSAMHAVESGNNPSAVSPVGAMGVSQTMPSTLQAPGFGVAPAADNSQAEQQRVGDQLLGAYTSHYGNPVLGHIAYNWGPGNTDKWLAAGADFSKLPAETQQYLGRIAVAQAKGGQAPNPQAAPAALGDPDAPRRAMFMRMAQLKMMQGDATGAKSFFDMARAGAPDGAVISGNGRFAEPVISTPNGAMPSQAYVAQGERATAAAKTQGTNSQTPVQVVGRNGPAVVSQDDMLRAGGQGQVGADGKPNWLPADSPQYKAIQTSQQAELGDYRKDAQASNTGLDTARELYNAANGLFTGKGAVVAQDIRKLMQTASQMTGIPIPAKIANSTSQFEQLKYAALNFVQGAAHSFSPRAAVQVVKLIQAAKPGEATSAQGLKAILEKQVIPAFLRARAMYGATEDYYQKNPLATDAQAQIPNKLPLTSFGVKKYPQQVNPGDFFISRHDGSLKQAPVE